MIIFYRLFLLLYGLGIRVTALWKPKAKAWLAGRRGQWDRLAAGVPKRAPGHKRIWIHCASLGEFEQGRPVIEAIRRDWPDAVIILSFFSPSGYEIRKDYGLADFVCYLPMDGPVNARHFIDIADPDAALFVKYEFWHYYLKTLHERHIPAILVSGAFRASQPFFRSWGGFFRNILKRFHTLTVQNGASLELLQGIGLGENALISGDTRYDRVLEIANSAGSVPPVERFLDRNEGIRPGAVIVAGSTWPKDEELLAAAWPTIRDHSDVVMILAPHELGEAHLKTIESLFSGCATTARLSGPDEDIVMSDILIVDNIGMLSTLYKYGTLAYIGGGFNAGGIHNILEPAVFGLPVYMGPVYDKFNEAVEMAGKGYAEPVRDKSELVSKLQLTLSAPGSLRAKRAEIREFVKSKGGATGRVMEVLRKAL